MENKMRSLPVARASSLGSVLRNPLVIFGLVLVAGDGPLVVAYSLTKDSSQAWVLLYATVLFIIGMGCFFCYLVAFKPRHLYAPTEIPENAFERSIYNDREPVKQILQEAKSIATDVKTAQDSKARKSLTRSLADKLQIADQLQKAYDLLFIPGYDLSLISDILESCERKGSVDPEAIAFIRHITPSTIDIILRSMISRGLVTGKGEELKISTQGQELLSSLRRHLRPIPND